MLTTDFLRAALALNVLGALMGWWGYTANGLFLMCLGVMLILCPWIGLLVAVSED